MMNNKFIKFAVTALILICISIAAAGCNTVSNIPSEYSVVVTYYLSGGEIENYDSNLESLDVYYMPNSKIAEPGSSSSKLKEVTLKGYSLVGWYIAQTDENGEVLTDENGAPLASDRKFDFATDVVTESITLVAVFGRSIRMVFNNLYYSKVGTRVLTKDCDMGGSITKPSYNKSYMSDGTSRDVEGYYWSYDEETGEYSDEIEWPVDFETLNSRLPEEYEESDGYIIINIYTKLSEASDEDSD